MVGFGRGLDDSEACATWLRWEGAVALLISPSSAFKVVSSLRTRPGFFPPPLPPTGRNGGT